MAKILEIDHLPLHLHVALGVLASELYAVADSEIPKIVRHVGGAALRRQGLSDDELREGMSKTAIACARASYICSEVLNRCGFCTSMVGVTMESPRMFCSEHPGGRWISGGQVVGTDQGWAGHAAVAVVFEDGAFLFDPTIGCSRRDYLPSNWPDMLVARVGGDGALVERPWPDSDKLMHDPHIRYWPNPQWDADLKNARRLGLIFKDQWKRAIAVLTGKVRASLAKMDGVTAAGINVPT